MSFLKLALLFLVVMIFVAAYALFGTQALPRFVFPLVSWGSLILMAFIGFRLSRRGAVQLGAVAITVQGFGVFSLMLGLAIGVNVMVSGGILIVRGEFEEFAPMIWPVIEGFVSAGLATLLVVILRLAQSIYFPSDVEAGGSIASGSGAGGFGGGPAATFAPELEKITASVAALNKELESAHGHARDMSKAMQGINSLLKGLGTMLENLDRFFADKD